MSDTVQNLADQLEGLPGYDYVVDKWNEYAGDRYKTKDPFVEELPNGKTRKLRLPSNSTNQERKVWKKIQKKAWIHDRCFMGCYPVDCGLGLAPILLLIPGIGPILMFAIHSRLITLADHNFDLDPKTTAKCNANILFDFLISLPPVLGSFLAWMNGCSTRNAALIHTRICKILAQRHERENNANVQMPLHGKGRISQHNKGTNRPQGRYDNLQDSTQLSPNVTTNNPSDPFKSPPQSPNIPKPPDNQAYYSRTDRIIDQGNNYQYASNNNIQQPRRNLPPPVVPPRTNEATQQPSLPPRVYHSGYNV